MRPRFSKILQKIVNNRVYKYLDENNLYFKKAVIHTAWKMSVFELILVCIFPQSDWILRISPYSVWCGKIWTRITPNTDILCSGTCIYDYSNSTATTNSIHDLLGKSNFSVGVFRSSPPEVLLGKCFLKIWIKFTGEHPCMTSIWF